MVEKPTVKKLDKVEHDGYTQYKVQVQAHPDGKSAEGYLLVPKGAGPFPAVIVPLLRTAHEHRPGSQGTWRRHA